MKNKLYKCIEDLQGANWCVGIVDTAQGWKERAIEYADMDGYEEVITTLTNMNDEDMLIDYICDVWQINIVPLINTKD
nr:MAG TPA: hypothetical protein [Caudoviricetes sp.]